MTGRGTPAQAHTQAYTHTHTHTQAYIQAWLESHTSTGKKRKKTRVNDMNNGREEKEAARSLGESAEPAMVGEQPDAAVETGVRSRAQVELEHEPEQPAEGGDSNLQAWVAESDRGQAEDSDEPMQRYY